ncbi:hypothetical protein AB832_07680 [Flavobacteriaceae bacterium (ex Bugula neritina AB1)]|nr:hypothetical protein AB832_07680 [Flavobacteriaceae bacterium (ex Bugula neritina AB1)]
MKTSFIRRAHYYFKPYLLILALTYCLFNFGLDLNVQARLIATWHEIVKAIDPKTQLKESDTLEDFAKF